jgi:hypothetical protein
MLESYIINGRRYAARSLEAAKMSDRRYLAAKPMTLKEESHAKRTQPYYRGSHE